MKCSSWLINQFYPDAEAAQIQEDCEACFFCDGASLQKHGKTKTKEKIDGRYN